MPEAADHELQAIGALQEPLRRSLYRFVAASAEPVSREQAAAAVEVQRNLAAFHLDKLVEAGLLEATYRRLSGRTGPGAGRPAKLYRRSSTEHAVSLPPRQYDLAAELLARAVDGADARPARDELSDVAHRFGHDLGTHVRAAWPPRASRERRLSELAQALERCGYEPRRDGRDVRLGNCPFHALAESHRELVCGMNLSLLQGVVDGLEAGDLEARPDPVPGACCVALTIPARKV